MKILNASAEYLDPTKASPYEFMERIGRICYKSENNITADSALRFVNRLFENKHTAMLEHAHIILKMNEPAASALMKIIDPSNELNQITPTINYINITMNKTAGCYVSASFRAFIELISRHSDAEIISVIRTCLAGAYPEIFEKINCVETTSDDMNCRILSRKEFIEDVQSYSSEIDSDSIIRKHITHTILFICDRGVSHELVRHRPVSFAQESTRYCNYSKDKFGKEISFIRPSVWSEPALANDTDGVLNKQYDIWQAACKSSEEHYFALLDNGASPQIARDVLHTSVKTEIAMTATESEWQHILNLRYHGTTGQPHPQMVEIMNIARPLLIDESSHRIN